MDRGIVSRQKYPFKAHAKDFSTPLRSQSWNQKTVALSAKAGQRPPPAGFQRAQSRLLLPESSLLLARSPLPGTRPPAGRTRPRTRRAQQNATGRAEERGLEERAGGARGGAAIRAVTIHAQELPGSGRRKLSLRRRPNGRIPERRCRRLPRAKSRARRTTRWPRSPTSIPLAALLPHPTFIFRLISGSNDLHTARPSVEVMPLLP